MQSDMFMDRAVAISEGSLSPTIKWKTLANQKFQLPSIEQQKEILEVLEKIYKQLNVVDETLHYLYLLRKSLERQFFKSINLIGNSKKKDCNIEVIGSLCEVKTGGTPKRNKSSYWNGDIPWMSSGEIHEKIVTKTLEHITQEGL